MRHFHSRTEKMRRRTEKIHPETGSSGNTLLRIKARNGSRRSHKAMPELHRGNIEQMPENNAFHSEVAEKRRLLAHVWDPYSLSLMSWLIE